MTVPESHLELTSELVELQPLDLGTSYHDLSCPNFPKNHVLVGTGDVEIEDVSFLGWIL